jgi:hypothetical protein
MQKLKLVKLKKIPFDLVVKCKGHIIFILICDTQPCPCIQNMKTLALTIKKKSYAQDKLYNNDIIYNKSEGIGS